jgi:hypothetical protein
MSRETIQDSTIKRLAKYRQDFQKVDDVINTVLNKLENKELPILTNMAKSQKDDDIAIIGKEKIQQKAVAKVKDSRTNRQQTKKATKPIRPKAKTTTLNDDIEREN